MDKLLNCCPKCGGTMEYMAMAGWKAEMNYRGKDEEIRIHQKEDKYYYKKILI